MVISNSETFGEIIGNSILVMITSKLHSPWPLDIEIQDLKIAGLNSPSIIRWKIFTLDNRLIIKSLGRLSPVDMHNTKKSFELLIKL